MKMYTFSLLLLCTLGCTLIFATDPSKYGVRVRLTKKGMEYAINIALEALQVDLKKEVIHTEGSADNFKYSINDMRIGRCDIGARNLFPVAGRGIRATVSNIALSTNGKLKFSYKKSWLPAIKDTVPFDATAEGVNLDVLVNIGASSSGRPTVSVLECHAVDMSLHLEIHTWYKFIYDLFRSPIENKLKAAFGKLLCGVAQKEVNGKLKDLLNTLPVVVPIDSYSKIDYELTNPPLFTSEYMDIFFKGQFLSRNVVEPSELVLPAFQAGTQSDKMLYFWVSDASINSAGSVYHDAGQLKTEVAAWDTKIPSQIRDVLNTNKAGLIIPEIESKYPNEPMAMQISSYKAPYAEITESDLKIRLFAHINFQARNSKGISNDLFSIKADIVADAIPLSKKGRIAATITSFDYKVSVLTTNVGHIPNLDNFLVKMAITFGIISKANPILEKGFVLPRIEHVAVTNGSIALEKNAIRIGTNVDYS